MLTTAAIIRVETGVAQATRDALFAATVPLLDDPFRARSDGRHLGNEAAR